MKCPSCGGEVGNNKFCQFCGSQISYDMKREQEQLNKQGCPKCGSSNVSFKREKQGEIKGKNAKKIINRTVGVCGDCGHTWYTDGLNLKSGNSSNTTLWWILGWICFFPIPVMILIWRKKNTWDIKVKLLVTIVFWLFIFIIGSAGTKNSDSNQKSDATPTLTEQNKNSNDTSNNNQESDNQTQSSDEKLANGYDSIDAFYEELVANNTTTNSYDLGNQVRDLAKKYELQYDSRNTGLGVMYYKVALTYDESRVISNGDIYKGTYYVYIIADYTKGKPEVHLVDNINNTEKVSSEEAVSNDSQEPTPSLAPAEMNALQTLFSSLSLSMTKDDIDKSIKENGFLTYAYSSNGGYLIGTENSAIRSRGRDREGATLEVSFSTSGTNVGQLISAEYHDTRYKSNVYLYLKKDGYFYYSTEKQQDGYETMQKYLQQ